MQARTNLKTDPQQRKERKLSSALLAGLCLLTPWSTALAVSSYVTPSGLVRLDYYEAGETILWEDGIQEFTEEERTLLTSHGTLPGWQREQLNFVSNYWDGLLKGTKSASQPAPLAVTLTEGTGFVGAGHDIIEVQSAGQTVRVAKAVAVLNYGKQLTAGENPAGILCIDPLAFPAEGQAARYDSPLWHYSSMSLVAAMIHETAHAMGVQVNGHIATDKRFPEMLDSYDSHLYDWRGVQAKAGMQIRTPVHGVDSPSYFDMPGYALDGTQEIQAPYFSGSHVSEVLQGASLRVHNFAGMRQNQRVPGLPVQGNESVADVDRIELSHIELRNGLLSHQIWRNYVSLMEAELALLQDLGYDIDRRDYFGRSIYGDGQTIVNNSPFHARNASGTEYLAGTYNASPYGMGLHIYGNENTVIQNASLMTRGMGAVGIRVDGYGNHVTVNSGVNVRSDGVNGNAILVAYGKNHAVRLEQGSTVTAAGEGGIAAAFDFGQNVTGNWNAERASYAGQALSIQALNPAWLDVDGPLVTDFTVQGELIGNRAAIYVSDNAFVKNIHIGTGARLSGDIVSQWIYDDDKIPEVQGATDEPLRLMRRQYAGDDELTTRLSFEGTGLVYGGNIIGADNMRLSVSGGLVYGGTATVLSATVDKGGSLFGGTYNLIPRGAVRSASSAAGYVLPYKQGGTKELKGVGLFTNHGTIGAASKDSVMTISGDLLSDGVLAAYAGGKGGRIDVTGRADINGSRVALANLGEVLPGDAAVVLRASSIEGDTDTPAGTSYAVSGMMSATNRIEGNTLSLVTRMENNLGDMDSAQRDAFDAMTAMYTRLKSSGDPRASEMAPLFGLPASEAKEALSSVSSNASATSMSVAQRSMMTQHILSSRLNEAFSSSPVQVKLAMADFTGIATDAPAAPLRLHEQANNDFWLKFGKNWGDVRGGTDYHSTATMVGHDKEVASGWRVGAFAGYSSTGFSNRSSSNSLKDTRLGLYAGYNHEGREALAYLDYGWMRTRLRRRVVGTTASARYRSRILELGGEFLYDIHADTNQPWHVRPFVNTQLSWLWQRAYTEEGAGVFNQVVDSKRNGYLGMGAGVEFKRCLPGGGYAFRAGVHHALAGAQPRLRYSYMGDAANTYDMRSVQDKTHLLLTAGGQAEIGKGWTIGADAGFTRGRHDRDCSLSVMIKKTW